MRDAPEPGESFAAPVYVRRRSLGLRGELAVLEIVSEGQGRLTLSAPAGEPVFSHAPSEFRAGRASRTTFWLQHGEERWWLSAVSFRSQKEAERVRRRIDRDDVLFAVPKLPEVDERTYNPLMSNTTAQQQAWCGLWLEALRHAGAQMA
jgi:hypothetical protein